MVAKSGADATSEMERGRRVGKYEILTRLSMGGMAELFLAYTSGPGGFRKFVAVKQILPDVKKDEQFVKMFLDEARITAAFSHGNIGQVFDLGEEDGELYLAMEFISGQNLEQVTKRAFKRQYPIPTGFACRVVRDACQGLHYAHAFTDPSGTPAPVVHRDVSPKNVMITYTGDVKMIDFGIAKAKGRLGRTQVGMVKGTSGYMSPEQVQNFSLDGRSDLFSVGVILHELLTGHRLFTGATDSAIMVAIVEGTIPSPRSLNPRIPEALSDVVMKALAQKREQRFATGKELARALDQAAASLIFDEDQLAAEMRALFDDKIQMTRSMLELATQDAGNLSEMAGALRDEAGEAAAKVATPRGRPSSTATPMPRQAPSATPGRGQRAKLAVPDTTEPNLGTRKPRSNPAMRPKPRTGGAGRYASKVNADYALYGDSEAATEQANARPSAADPHEPITEDVPNKAVRARSARAGLTGQDVPPPPEGRAGLWVGLVLFALLGAAGAAFATLDAAAPLRERLAGWVQGELQGEPPPPPPSPLEATPQAPPPPQALRLLEQPPKADGPVTQLPENYIDEPLPPDPWALQAEADAKARDEAKANGQDSKKGVGPARPRTPDGNAVVLDTKSRSGAAKAGVGWLSLFTVPPAAVFDGQMSLGTTPLVKVPMEEGTYRLRVIDPDGEDRVLSAPIRPGQVTTLKVRVADLPAEN